VRLEKLGKLKKIFNDLIGTQNFYLLSCSIAHQPFMLSRAPWLYVWHYLMAANNLTSRLDDMTSSLGCHDLLAAQGWLFLISGLFTDAVSSSDK
jgi:hypothetical protein